MTLYEYESVILYMLLVSGVRANTKKLESYI